MWRHTYLCYSWFTTKEPNTSNNSYSRTTIPNESASLIVNHYSHYTPSPSPTKLLSSPTGEAIDYVWFVYYQSLPLNGGSSLHVKWFFHSRVPLYETDVSMYVRISLIGWLGLESLAPCPLAWPWFHEVSSPRICFYQHTFPFAPPNRKKKEH